MAFDLVDSRRNTSNRKQIPEFLHGKVAYANCLCLSGIIDCFHSLPCARNISWKEVFKLKSHRMCFILNATRHLLSEEAGRPPPWVGHEERSLLSKSTTTHLIPNVTVAKDGGGNFTRMTDALASMPENRHGR
ncbi:hypothetical protein Nepgr_025145 [Nepenthes gracilis]|uniref:Uncharacterized protein n=1 Tax=Nepenthes gracilis TaxID=150966 RepID=A0AAD3T5X5_NEPGR|nr:hypothetical protein Nepgr_025145 [Nepenthes gracilis]